MIQKEGGNILEISGVSYGFKVSQSLETSPVIQNISFVAIPGEIVAILGPSGCGKTTLLNIIASLITPSAGLVRFANGQNVKGVGYVFQFPSLVPWLTVRSNALYGVDIRRGRNASDEKRCDDLLCMYGLGNYGDSYPSILSGGMQQRVAIIRAAIADFAIILLDEPFSHSDFLTKRELQKELSRLVDEEELIAIYVTHDIEEAVRIGDKVIVLSARPAQVKAQIEISMPRTERIQGGAAVMEELARYVDRVETIFSSAGQNFESKGAG